ncbi:sensor protein FixL [bacterium BMS3Bbin08]|nr:sensor protein FixL [bacterium BMS3Bbin08]
MKDRDKTKEYLMGELVSMRQQLARLEKAVAERRTAEEGLRKSEEKFRSFMESAPDHIVQLDRVGTILYANKTYEGIRMDKLIGTSIYSWMPEKYRSKIRSALLKVFETAGPLTVEYPVRSLKGEVMWYLGHMGPIKVNDQVDSVIFISRDITGRRQMETDLYVSEDRYRMSTRAAKTGVWDWDMSTNKFYIDPLVKEFLGYREEEIQNDQDAWAAHMHPDDRVSAMKATQACIEGKMPEYMFEHRMAHKDGSVRWILTRGTVIRDLKGDPIRMIGTATDITERKQTEKALIRSEEKYRKLYDNAPDMYHTLDRDGIITDCNRTWEIMLGYKKEEIIGRPFADFLTDGSKKLFRKIFPKSVKEANLLNVEREFVRKDGSVLPVILNITIESDENGELVRTGAIARDITNLKKAERQLSDAYQKLKATQEQLIQAGKMAAMGQLAAGISHELNQPLTGIKGFAQAALMDIGNGDPLKKDLEKIVEQADRMDRIIQHVRFFARKSDFEIKEQDVNSPIEDALSLLSEQLRVHNIRVQKSLVSGLPKIMGDQNQLEQVFLNLITNARDAIDSRENGDGGVITLRSALSKDREHVEVICQDTGCGISEHDFEHIYNPFFTTKSPDGGMGLGLSIVYRIIEDHRGSIKAESRKGEGTTFKITLPVIKEVAPLDSAPAVLC